jgi:hypothetical protein
MAGKGSEKVKAAPVEDYPERPYDEAVRSPEDTVLAEGRTGAVDQYPRYHEVFKTLKPGPAHDQTTYEEAILDAQPKPTKAEVKAEAEALPEVTAP